MMATGLDFFTVELQTPTGQVLPSIEYDGQRYFVGEPGQEFVVKVTRSMRYPNKLYRVSFPVCTADLDSNQPSSTSIKTSNPSTYSSVLPHVDNLCTGTIAG